MILHPPLADWQVGLLNREPGWGGAIMDAPLPKIPTLVDFLRAHLPPDNRLTECRHCGNPAVERDTPCRYCSVITEPTPTRPLWCCQACGHDLDVRYRRDPGRSATLLDVGCPACRTRASAEVADVELEDAVEQEDARRLLAARLRDAIGRLRDPDRSV